MKRVILTVGMICLAFADRAAANPRLDAWLEMMKLTYTCKEDIKYRTAQDAALNLAERLRPDEDLKWQVLATDKALRFNRISAKIGPSECANAIDQMTSDLIAKGYF
ncbi:hypothetical protein LB572_29605 [Mesorhizobium sp. BH1-1-5]|uniref:hypothetical protein n=1 Tax=Mesorhizobium sp. BH1-1-5 TaxID=2876661 RepID=UPI001CCD7E42|nr:hypothetical protein [Mesorhizobium sp. BH1-1-5]MBZ9991253.1 hypothetical protein [Mesorhizobium sp. BH1-1-5]